MSEYKPKQNKTTFENHKDIVPLSGINTDIDADINHDAKYDIDHEGEETSADERIAIALEYDGENAPYITATGEDATADEIIELAKQHDIPLMENSELAHLLAKLELGDEIPEILYLSIAQIIAFVYMLQGKAPEHVDTTV